MDEGFLIFFFSPGEITLLTSILKVVVAMEIQRVSMANLS